MAFRWGSAHLLLASNVALAALLGSGLAVAGAQVFVVGEKTAMSDVSTEFHPTRIELPSTPITERGRRDLVRNLEAEQGFAHRPLPLGYTLTLMANGKMTPDPETYKQVLYKKGESAVPGDRVAITKVSFKENRIVMDINGGPYLKHRFLRHVELNDIPMVADNGEQVTGFRIELEFEGGIPEISAPEVKALLDPLIDFGAKSGGQAYAETLPTFLKDAIQQHDVLVGMNRKMVLAAKGEPASKIRELIPGSNDQHYEEWIYGQMPQTVYFVRFEGDRVVRVRVAALGQPIATYDKNQMQGYQDPGDTREIAMGDTNNGGGGDAGAQAPPTILKPGERAPGGSGRVRLPVPDVGNDQDKSAGGIQSRPSADPQTSASTATGGLPAPDMGDDKYPNANPTGGAADSGTSTGHHSSDTPTGSSSAPPSLEGK